MILVRTPLRVSLFGGGTDYPAWFESNTGAVLGMAIDKYCYTGVKHMPPGQELRYRVQYSKVDDCMFVGQIKHPAIKGILRHLNIDTPLEFHCFGDLPGRSGLGGSSAFTVGMLLAVRKLMPELSSSTVNDFDPWVLADEAIFVEQVVIQEAVGCQDQIFAAHGGLKYITFSKQNRIMNSVVLPSSRLEELETSLVLVYSGTMRDAHVMAEKQIKEIPGKAYVLNEMAALAEHGMLELSSRSSIEIIGELLNDSWELKKKISAEITNTSINMLYEHGIQCGATGGKLLGAGGGGFMLFFVPARNRRRFEDTIAAPTVSFKVSHQGAQVIIDK